MTVPWEDVNAAYEEDKWELSGKTATMAIMERPLNDKQKRYYNVATAASITGFVRAYLWRAICASSGVIYCDTDCIVASDVRGVKFDGAELGAWDIEARSSYGGFAGKKLYAIQKSDGEFKTASKGVKLTHKEILAVAKGQEVTYKNDAPTFRRKGKKPVTFVERTVKMT